MHRSHNWRDPSRRSYPVTGAQFAGTAGGGRVQEPPISGLATTEQTISRQLNPFLKSIGPGHVYGGVGAVLPALSVVSAVAASVVLIVVAAIMAGHVALKEPRIPRPSIWFAGSAAVFLLYATLSAAWAIDPGESFWTGIRLLGLFGCGLFILAGVATLSPDGRAIARRLLLVGMVVGLGFFAVELLGGASITYAIREATGAPPKAFSILFNRTASVVSLFLWPALIVLIMQRKWIYAGVLTLATVWLGSLTESGASMVGLGAGFTAFMIVWIVGKAGIRGLALLISAGIVLTPLIVIGAHSMPLLADAIEGANAFGHRMRIWQFAIERAFENPVFGLGLDAARHLSTGGSDIGANADLMPLHPHNIPVQIWLELGLVGAVLAAAFFAIAGLLISRIQIDRLSLGLVAGHAVCAVIIIGLSYGAWQWWWLSTLWLSAAMTAAVLQAPETPEARTE